MQNCSLILDVDLMKKMNERAFNDAKQSDQAIKFSFFKCL